MTFKSFTNAWKVIPNKYLVPINTVKGVYWKRKYVHESWEKLIWYQEIEISNLKGKRERLLIAAQRFQPTKSACWKATCLENKKNIFNFEENVLKKMKT